MMGRRKGEQGQLFYAFDLEAVVPDDHQVRLDEAQVYQMWPLVHQDDHWPLDI